MKQILNEEFRRMQKLAGILTENQAAKDKVLDFLYSDEIKQDVGVSDYVMSDDSDWDRVKDYINGKGISGVTAKQVFLNRNKDVSEQDFEKYYDEWLDYIEDERNMESRNQQDFNYDF